MIDIKKIRDDFEGTAAQLARRGVEKENVKKAFDLDIRRRSLISRTEELKAKRNAASKEIGAKARVSVVYSAAIRAPYASRRIPVRSSPWYRSVMTSYWAMS